MRPLVPLSLYLLALVVRLSAAGEVSFPTTEAAGYYSGVAENLVAGHGLVSDAVWSFATPPLTVPKPAFELWLPMSTFLSAAAMAVVGSTFWAAQLAGSIVGAALAPLAWAVGRDAARAQGLDQRRGRAVALTAGVLAAILSPLVLGSIVPDSSVPFAVFMLAAALLIPRVVGPSDGSAPARPLAGLTLGLCLGLAYLSRQEVIWMGLIVVLFLAWSLWRQPTAARLPEAARRLAPVVIGGLIIVTPWLVRNWLELGSPFPGQAAENLFLVRNEDIFAFTEHPAAATYLAQSMSTILTNPLRAAWDGLVGVIVLPAFPVGVAGLVSVVGLWRAPVLRRPTALLAVLASGALIFLSTALLFPIATLWGTFMHASGALLVGLAVAAALGGDALLARISLWRAWDRPNVLIAPVALVAVTALFTILQVRLASEQAEGLRSTYTTAAESLADAGVTDHRDEQVTLITDHPMWLADTTGALTVALPDEPLASLVELGRTFDTPWVVVIGQRGRYPAMLLAPEAESCLDAEPVRLAAGPTDAWLFRLADGCPAT